MPQQSHSCHSSLTLALLATAFIIIALPSCSETQDLSDQELTAETKQSAGSVKATHDGSPPQITGDTIQETIKATGDEPKNKYTTISTVIGVPKILSDTASSQEVNLDRHIFHSSLQDYKNNLQAKLYCFDRESRIYTESSNGYKIPSPTAPCRFLTQLLTKTPLSIQYNSDGFCQSTQRCRHTALIRRQNYIAKTGTYSSNWSKSSFWGTPITHYQISQHYATDFALHEHHRLRVIIDTLEFFDSIFNNSSLQSLYRKPIPISAMRVFKPDDTSMLRVIINLAYADTETTPQTLKGDLIKIYGQDSLPSFLFFSLLDHPRDNLQSIPWQLGGLAFTGVLSQQKQATDADHPITTAMQTITHSIKVYAQGTKLTTKQPVAKIGSITIGGSTLRKDEYAVIKSAIYIAKDASPRPDDIIKIEYVAAATP